MQLHIIINLFTGKEKNPSKTEINKGHIKQHSTRHRHFYLLCILRRDKHVTWQVPAHSKDFYFSVWRLHIISVRDVCLSVFMNISHQICLLQFMFMYELPISLTEFDSCLCVRECNWVWGCVRVVEGAGVTMSYLWSAALLLPLSCLVCVDWDLTNLMTVSISYSDWQKGHRCELLWCSFEDTSHIQWIDREIDR